MNFLPSGTRGLRGVVRKLVRDVRLEERVGWGISLVRSRMKSIHPAFDNFPGKCAELERAVKFVNNPKGAYPPEMELPRHRVELCLKDED